MRMRRNPSGTCLKMAILLRVAKFIALYLMNYLRSGTCICTCLVESKPTYLESSQTS